MSIISVIITVIITVVIAVVIAHIVSAVRVNNHVITLANNESDAFDAIVKGIKMGCTVSIACYKHAIEVDGNRYEVVAGYWDRIHAKLDANGDPRVSHRHVFVENGNVFYSEGVKGIDF